MCIPLAFQANDASSIPTTRFSFLSDFPTGFIG
jgi:hypothetical protein